MLEDCKRQCRNLRIVWIIIKDASAICNSLLTDWQKVEAVNTFVISQATYYLQAVSPSLGWTRQLDNRVRALVKKGVNLPKRTISEFFYLKRKYGGLGLFSFEDNLELATLSQALRCLNSPDAVVRALFLLLPSCSSTLIGMGETVGQ